VTHTQLCSPVEKAAQLYASNESENVTNQQQNYTQAMKVKT